MNFRGFIVLLVLIITGCTTAQPLAPAASTVTFGPLPTDTSAITPTPPPSTTSTITQTPAPLPTGREIIFEDSGNTDLTGTLYGEGKTAIILANMSIGGKKQWDPFVAAVDKHKFTTITFEYRDINDVNPDMDVLLAWLREEGFERAACIGASLGTRACSSIAREPEIAGIVLIAGSVHHASVAETTYPKLFISGALDVWAFDIQRGFEQAAEPKTLMLFEDNRAHGTDLFSSKDREAVLTSLIDFVNSLESP